MGGNEKGELEGRLAESWQHSSDFRTWTVHLRKNVRWHDGVPVTAGDIKFTLDLLTHPDVHYYARGAFTIDVLDDSSYTITCYHKAIGSPLDDWTVYYPQHLLERLDPKKYWDWEFWRHPVGDGPYRFLRRVPKTMVELEANPNYYAGKPRIERVVLKFGDPSGSGAVTELLSGNVDAIPWMNRAGLAKLQGDPRFRVYDSVYHARVKAIAWNERRPFFADPKIRRALTLAINRRELHQLLNFPEWTPIFDVLFTRDQLRRGELPPPLPYDPKQASRLLDEAGWRAQAGDGARQREGKPFRFTLLVYTISGMNEAAIYVQAALRRLGIQMDISTMDEQAQRQRVGAGDFDAAIFIMPDDGPFGPRAVFGDHSLVGYKNPTVIALLDKAQATANPEEIDRIHRKLAPIFQADLPATFLYPAVYATVAHRRVRGLSSPYRASPVGDMEHLWLENETRQ
ncbi:MAG: ABC transporter substrate-binding protein [Thermoanaerobaculia bacterium]